jgi:hypothetical protein
VHNGGHAYVREDCPALVLSARALHQLKRKILPRTKPQPNE